jgi:hypothetical protein
VVRPRGFEPLAYSFGDCRSIQLSYGRTFEKVIMTRSDTNRTRVTGCVDPPVGHPQFSVVSRPATGTPLAHPTTEVNGMSSKLMILVASAATCLATLPASADPQRGHPVVPPPHATGPKSATPTPATAPTTAPTAPATNPVAAKIATMPQLNAKITALLPPNMTLDAASAGFRNQGQFIAALHVSHNLGIPFTALKNEMTVQHLSLGQSIQTLSKTADAPREVKRAEAETTTDLKSAKHRSNR